MYTCNCNYLYYIYNHYSMSQLFPKLYDFKIYILFGQTECPQISEIFTILRLHTIQYFIY